MIKFKFLTNLPHTPRWAGKRLLFPESVSDHIWGMNALAIEFVSGTDIFSPDLLKDLIYRITLHDVGESLYCDIPRTFKYHNAALSTAINSTEETLIIEKFSNSIAKDIINAKSKDPSSDSVGFLVSVFDVIQAGLKMREEILLGNSYFESEIWNSISVIDEYIKLYKEFASRRNERYYSSLEDSRDKYIIKYMKSYRDYLANVTK